MCGASTALRAPLRKCESGSDGGQVTRARGREAPAPSLFVLGGCSMYLPARGRHGPGMGSPTLLVMTAGVEVLSTVLPHALDQLGFAEPVRPVSCSSAQNQGSRPLPDRPEGCRNRA